MTDTVRTAGPALADTPPSGMVVMLYEETVASLTRAVESVSNGDLAGRNRHAARAADIIELLYGCLDMQRGGEIAANLERLYRMVLGRLVVLNAGRDPQPGREAIELLNPLLQAWSSIDRKHRDGIAAAA